MNGKIQESIAKGLTYLRAAQSSKGMFASESLEGKQKGSARNSESAIVINAAILGALSSLEDEDAVHIRHSLAAWLLAQKQPHLTFGSTDARDIGATFAVAEALVRHDATLITGETLAQIVHALIQAEQKVGGPYITDGTGDIDVIINCQIAAFLQCFGSSLPHLKIFLSSMLHKQRFDSKRYVAAGMGHYAWALAHTKTQSTSTFADFKFVPQSPLSAALYASSKQVLGLHTSTAEIQYLLQAQRPDGSWPTERFFAQSGQTFGARALTTAYALEALAGCLHAHRPHDPFLKFRDQIVKTALEDFGAFAEPLRSHGKNAAAALARADDNKEIMLLPHFFAQSLVERPPEISEAFCHALGRANVHCWLAYTIYDNFLDNEGDPAQLPIANVAHRLLFKTYQSAMADNTDFMDFVHHTLNTMDEANAWEVETCRFDVKNNEINIESLPSYGQGDKKLAERSLGHALGPMAILCRMGQRPDSLPAQTVMRGFRYYLTARQLNDDVLDWREDLCAGNITLAVATILNDAKIRPGRRAIDTLLPSLEECFWNISLQKLCARITTHTAHARQIFVRSKLLAPQPNPIFELLDIIDHSVAHTLHNRRCSQEFLQNYQED